MVGSSVDVALFILTMALVSFSWNTESFATLSKRLPHAPRSRSRQ
jgi:hypothetical protein